MKNCVPVFVLFMFLIPGVILYGQDTEKVMSQKTGFWFEKMQDPNLNYFELVREFNSFWEGKTPQKGSGYKQFKRWADYKLAYANADGSLRLPQQDLENAMNYNSLYASLSISGTWSYFGPPQTVKKADQPLLQQIVDGRTTAIGFNPHNSNVVYAGAPYGGLWVSYNSGGTWQNMNTDNISALGVSAIAVHPTVATTLFIGTGDRDAASTTGLGIYKSTDGGLTWVGKPISTTPDKRVYKILFHPSDPDRMVIAVNYGCFTSHDGGEHWSHRQAGNFIDMEQKPGDTVLYAVSDNNFFRSFDFGETWTKVHSWADCGRMALGTSADEPEKVVVFQTKNGQFHDLWISTDAGDHFSRKYAQGVSTGSQSGYNVDFIMDPLNAEVMYCGLVDLFKSTDGGATWVNQDPPVTADDQHILEIHPVTHRVFLGNDSGIWYKDDGGVWTWSSQGLNVANVNRIDVAADNPDHVIMGLQDGSTLVTEDGTLFYSSCGGDGQACQIDPQLSGFTYGSGQGGGVQRSMNGGGENANFLQITAKIKQPGDFNTEYILDQTTPSVMFAGRQDVWRSTNIRTPDTANITWTNISRGTIVYDNSTIVYLEQSPANRDILYAGTSASRLFRTLNATAPEPVWRELSVPDNPNFIRLVAHPTRENFVYMATGGKVYRSTDKGLSWQDISGDLPPLGTRAIAYMKGSPDGLFIGTTAGVYYKDTTMAHWLPFKTGLPIVQVSDITINYSTTPAQVFVATFARGVWKTTALTHYQPDLIAGSGTATINGTTVSSVTGAQSGSTSMVTVDEISTGYYLSTNNIIGSGDYLVGESTYGPIAPGLIFQQQLPSTDVAQVTPEIPSGTYYFGMLLDNHLELDESAENNNTWVNAAQVTIPVNPGAPTNVLATDGTYVEKTTITWENNTGEPLYFAVYRSTTSISSTAVQISPSTWGSSTTFDDVTATNGLQYYYWVKSSRYPTGIRSSGFSGYNSGWRKLAPPANVNATDGQFNNRVVISWSPSNGASHYRVYRNTIPVVGETMYISGPNWITSTSFTDLTAATGTTYYYWVKASKSSLGGTESDYSTANTGWVAFASAPDAAATDGTYTNRIEVTWNSVAAAPYYKLYRSSIPNPDLASAITSWQTATSYTDLNPPTGVVYYYWVKASNDASGTLTTGFGAMDPGFSNYSPPGAVNATDGSYTGYCQITWSASSGASYYRVYRTTTSTPNTDTPVRGWQTGLKANDYSGVPGEVYYYWVKAAGDTTVTITDFSGSNTGYRGIDEPVVTASTGIYPDKVRVIWEPAEGASYYRVIRAPASNPTDQTVLANYSNTLNFQYDDFTAVSGVEYIYYVRGAVNSSGLRGGRTGDDIGFAGSCGNLVDDPALRSVNFHGTILEISGRVVNEGPYPLLNPGQISLALESGTPYGTPEANIGVVTVPALAVGAGFSYSQVVDLDTVTGFTFSYGTWFIGIYTSWDDVNCDSDPDDDYIVWDYPSFTYTDALHGIYTIGPLAGDFYDVAKALEALQERGVSDQVTFNIEPGLYPDKLTFTSIPGASSSKTVTFRTDPSATDTAVISATPYPGENYTIRFQNCSFVTLRNLKLASMGYTNYQSTFGRVISIEEGSHDLSFRFNRIQGYTEQTNISDDNAVIYAGNISGQNLSFEGNLIQNGTTAMYFAGKDLNTNPMTGLQVTKNTIRGFMDCGISLLYQNYPVISENILENISNLTINLRGISMTQIRNGFLLTGNKITLSGNGNYMMGITSSNINLDGNQPGLITNNFISIGGNNAYLYGILFYNMHKTRILHNNLHLYGPNMGFSTGLLADCEVLALTFDNSLMNNNILNQAGGHCLVYGEVPDSQGLLSESDYNNFLSAGTSPFLYRGNPLASLSAWRSETGFDANSLATDPLYYSATDLHVTSSSIDGAGVHRDEVTSDIDGDPRPPIRPDIGADEFIPGGPAKTLILSALLEGLYDGNNTLRQAYDESGPHFSSGIADRITLELHDASNYSHVQYTSYNVNLSTTGAVSATIPGIYTGSYYITLKHRNSIETVSATPVSFSGTTIAHPFINPSTVYGGNLLLMIDGRYVIFSGDVNQDGFVDTADMTLVDNDASVFAIGYMDTDLSGDGFVDTSDFILIDNNTAGFVSAMTP